MALCSLLQDPAGASRLVYSVYLWMRMKMQQIEPDDVMVSHVTLCVYHVMCQ